MQSNAINWFEIPAADILRAKQFYEALYAAPLEYGIVGNGLHMVGLPGNGGVGAQGFVGGAVVKHEMYTPSHRGALVYLNANPDLQTMLSRVEGAGGKVLMPKTLIKEDIGYMALFEDSEGNRVALHSDR